MRKILLSIFIIAFVHLAFGQGTTVVISGQVTSGTLGTPVANQPVMIFSDSSYPMYMYYNTVYTNAQGYYNDLVTIPTGVQMMFFITTVDCQGMAYVANGVSTNSPLVNNFSIPCGAVGTGCNCSFTYTATGLSVSFAGSTQSSSATTYTWSFGDGSSGSGQNVNHTYASAGAYGVTLTTIDAAGCASTFLQQVIVGNTTNCQAAFSIYPDTSSPGYSYYFIDMSIGSNYNTFWDFGDGTTSFLANPQHTYSQSGVYTICLTISDSASGCYSVLCDSLFVGTVFNCSNSFGYQVNNYVVAFNSQATGTPPFSYQWNFGDNTVSTAANPTHTYGVYGTYFVSLTTTDANGCVAYSAQYVTISGGSGNCMANYVAYPDSNNPALYYFSDQSTGNPINPVTSWFWTFGDGSTSNLQHPTHVYSAPGFYAVCLTIATGNSGTPGYCTDTYCDSVYVSLGSSCNVSFTYQDTALTAMFAATATGTAPFTYTWSFGDGSSGTGSNVTHTYTSPGSYTVNVYITDANGCFSISTQTIVIGNIINQQISGQVYTGLLPASNIMVTLMGFNPGSGVIIYDSTVTTPNGSYYFNNVQQGIYIIMAAPLPNSSAYLMYIPTYYGNTPHWGTATVVSVGIPSNPYNINLLVVPGTAQGPALVGGNVTYTGIKFSGKDSPATGVEIILKNQVGSILDIRYSDVSGLFDFSNIPYGSYEVYAEVPGLTTVPAFITLNATNPVVNNISIVITNSGVVTSIGSIASFSEFLAYPNPAKDILYLDVPGQYNGEYKLYSQDGRLVMENILNTAGKELIEIDLKEVDQGVYFLRIIDEGNVSGTIKVIVR